MQYSDFRNNNFLSQDNSTMHLPKPIDRYQDYGMALVEESAVKSLDYAQTLPANEREEYAKAFHEFNRLYQSRKSKHTEVPTNFVDPIRPKDVKFRKGKRRGLSLREALEEEEVEEPQRRQVESIEQSQLERHNALFQPQASNQQPQESTNFSDQDLSDVPQVNSDVPAYNFFDQDLSDGPQVNSDVPAYESENNESDNNIQYLGTQARSPLSVPSLNCSDPIPDPEISESDSDDLVDIDKLLLQQVPPPLVSLSQNLTTSQLPPSTAPMMTRTARGVV